MNGLNNAKFQEFATDLARYLSQEEPGLTVNPKSASKLSVIRGNGEPTTLDLVPVLMKPEPVTAGNWFGGVNTSKQLINAYDQCYAETTLENDFPEMMQDVHNYAEIFRRNIFDHASTSLSNDEARLIAEWVSQFDCYCAIKAVESLLISAKDRALLTIAKRRGWVVYMDHLAIRCGSSKNGDAKRVADFLCGHFAYVTPQLRGEEFYRFDDGWEAYPRYKMLENGLMMRLFIDESSKGFPLQIIQHWHHVYGYTAHHLALRVARETRNGLVSVSVPILIAALSEQGVTCKTPTGDYTGGLLEQVFTEPVCSSGVPDDIKKTLLSMQLGLEQVIENSKLIELVSRREMPATYAKRYFTFYGIQYDANNPQHSAPCYPYFLPAQAAHVIRTSLDVV
ncbi:MAG: hypothetical protein COB30_000650 [Ectothiorhodospiraceae bacterium]|nr:hypothetical protein [Ectothiorhodospiraceae bacterium]